MATQATSGIVRVDIDGVEHSAEYELIRGVLTLSIPDGGCAAVRFRCGDVKVSARELLIDVVRNSKRRDSPES